MKRSAISVVLLWRFWGVGDGLSESNTSWLAIDGQGAAWAKHGGNAISRLDGHSVSNIPDPFEGGRLEASAAGDLWLLKGRDLRKYEGREWRKYQVPEAPADNNAYAAFGKGRVVVLTPQRLLRFDAASGEWRTVVTAEKTALTTFSAIRQGVGGAVWIAGQSGAAVLRPNSGWTDWSAPRELSRFAAPREGDDGELFLSAMRAGKPVLVRVHDGRWDVFYQGDRDPLRAWRGGDHDLWVADGNQVMRLADGRRELVERTDAFSGLMQNQVAGSQGAFWVTTSQGIARYTPPLWRRYEGLDDVVTTSCEGADGSVWFLSSRYLVGFEGNHWKKYPMPAGFRLFAGAEMKPLADGRLAIATSTPQMLIFDPAGGRFRVLRHPEGRTIRTFAQRRDGKLFVQTLNPKEREDFRLEIFDGAQFRPWLDLGKGWGFWDIRSIAEAANGDVWLGAVNGMGVVRDGKFRRVSVGDEGAFAIAEESPGHFLIGGRKELREFDGKNWTTLRAGLDRVRSISRASDGTLWIASGTGVHRLRNGNWITNETEDGLPSSVAYSVLSDSHGRVWAGTTRGIGRFRPEADMDPPATRIAAELNSRSISPDGDARIVFSGEDKWKATETSRLVFSYRLDGGPWTPFAPLKTAVYQDLKSGQHHFEARAMDRNGNIDLSPAAFNFRVLVPWYRQGEFLGLAAAALLAIFILIRLAWLHHLRLKFDSSHDPLTRLANRRAFEAALQGAIGAAREEGSAVAVLLLDLDQFKPINDTLGHAAGDCFLQEVALRLQSCARRNDTLARIGGDEFALVLPGATQASAESMARRIVEQMRRPCRIDDRELRTTASIGISLYPNHAQDVSSLKRLADLAMYQCKARSRDSYCLFETKMSVAAPDNAKVAELLRQALNCGYLAVDYQPILRPDGQLFALEGFVRMEHPEAGHLAPSDFIAVAEETGLIVPLGTWVLSEVCQRLAAWRKAGHAALRVSVNISSAQLLHPGFIGTVFEALRAAKLAPDGLILEVPETANPLLEELRAVGIAIALDHFAGTLHLRPIDYVKVDRNITADVIGMAQRLGFQVIATGIETEEQMQAFQAAGCDLLQGYLLGYPRPAAEAVSMADQCLAMPPR